MNMRKVDVPMYENSNFDTIIINIAIWRSNDYSPHFLVTLESITKYEDTRESRD